MVVLYCFISTFLFALIANNNQSAIFWPWGHLNFIDQDSFKSMFVAMFEKTNLGIGRVLNNLALFTVAYVLLTKFWSIIDKWVGWLLIPLGQNSLYAFTLHVYFILLIYNTGLLDLNSVIVNTLIHPKDKRHRVD